MNAPLTPIADPTPWYKSKTMWLGAITTLLGVLDYLQTLPLPPGLLGIIGVLVIGLRMVTTTGLAAK